MIKSVYDASRETCVWLIPMGLNSHSFTLEIRLLYESATHLFCRYLKQCQPKRMRRKSTRTSQDLGHFEGEDDEAKSIVSCPTGSRKSNSLKHRVCEDNPVINTNS